MFKTLITVSILSLGLAGGAVAQTTMNSGSSMASDTQYGTSANPTYGTSGAGTVDPTVTYSTSGSTMHQGTSLSSDGNCSAPVPVDQVEQSKNPVTRTQC